MDSCKFFASACLYVEQTDLLVEGIPVSSTSAFRSKCPAFLLAVLTFLQVGSFVPKDLSLFRVGA
jgi:prepilin signal peptidase PulO-like enzyme (type II secretory pathway)